MGYRESSLRVIKIICDQSSRGGEVLASSCGFYERERGEL